MHDAVRLIGFIAAIVLMWRVADIFYTVRVVRDLCASKRSGKETLSGAASVLLVRHGESIVNAKGILKSFFDSRTRRLLWRKGNGDTPLTEKGITQARELGLRLRLEYGVPDYIYHSSYARARDTAAAILAQYSEEEQKKIQVVETDLIRERYVTENIYEIIERLGAFLHASGGETAQKKVIIVSHDRIIRSIKFLFDYFTTGKFAFRNLVVPNQNCGAVLYRASDRGLTKLQPEA